MNKVACVIGGSGFLGSHVADRLSNAGYKVRIFDRELSPWLSDNQEMVIGDITNQDDVNYAIQGSEVVYNFAALSDLNEGLDKPIETIEVNILGNALAMNACLRHKVKRFVYASTVYVHSREGGFYRCSKQASENYVEEFSKVFGLNYTILRYGSLYGPRSDEKNGLYRIIKGALESGIVRYEGSSEALREYIHVIDAAEASVAALQENFLNESIVLTGQEPMRVSDLLEMVAEILGDGSEVEFKHANYSGHYVRTPYAYMPKPGRKYISPMHVDLGQGIIQLIAEIDKSTKN